MVILTAPLGLIGAPYLTKHGLDLMDLVQPLLVFDWKEAQDEAPGADGKESAQSPN